MLSALLASVILMQQGSPLCLPRDVLAQHLLSRFNETPTTLGITDSGAVLEVFASPSGSTWTLVITSPARISCLMANGSDWQHRAQPTQGHDI